MRKIYFLMALILFIGGGVSAMAFELKSPAFKTGEYIPDKYSCEGENISPALSWSGAPEGAKSFVLIVDDPDAPAGDWVHWLVYDIPAQMDSLKDDHSRLFLLEKSPLLEDSITNFIKQGKTSFGTTGYGGPCPPPGKPHRYFFKLYSLDIMLNLGAGLTKQQLLRSIEGHVLAQGQLMGLYKR